MSILKSLFKRKDIRVRFAPSPTGLFHIGSARSTLFNFLFAKTNGGKFILRIEDTDQERSKPEYEKDILESIKWLGLNWDEFYRQSERLKLYAGYIKKLLLNGSAFYCFHSKEFLENEYEEQIKTKKNPAHHCEFRKLPIKDVVYRLNKESGIIRFKTPLDFEISFTDLIRGKISFNSDTLGGDFSLAKVESPLKFTPLYNLAVVIDDYEMKISHVIRGEEHISNTPKQILIQRELNLTTPEYAHLPLILAPDRSKLSKRHGAASVMEYREMGYLPETLVNFLALLGWNPGSEKEIFTLAELIKKFDLGKVQKGGAIFNTEKLDWLNGHYIRSMPIDELTKKIIPFLEKDGLLAGNNFEYIKKVVALEKLRLKKLSEIGERVAYFFKIPEYRPELLVWRDMLFKDIATSLKVSLETISYINETDFNCDNLEKILLKEAERAKNKDRGRLLWPLRMALTGLEKSPGPFEIMEILGKKRTLERIETALKKLNAV
ncbi:MAG: Glutamate-tRNA ligase [Candidatus Azambacteria bacterium GW2011_GWA2_39_10]|uniref:Glutamate--tRNA ligase n=1 Tax=Candidatus Azambacteria bacterium GW2011_GWA2_39_10 TaxID=1618611 RepID=A0A0G0LY66_9BACT|nr:MAG: Glutamate-tRNA ligase [Candidatus Azambacteria bacterium GW2011_GWA2_39_10]